MSWPIVGRALVAALILVALLLADATQQPGAHVCVELLREVLRKQYVW